MIDKKKQRYLLILALVWLFAPLILIIVLFSLTHDSRSLALVVLIAPPIAVLPQLYHYYFPPSAAYYERQRLKFQKKGSPTKAE